MTSRRAGAVSLVAVALLLAACGEPASVLDSPEAVAFRALDDADLARELDLVWPAVARQVDVPLEPRPSVAFVTMEQLAERARDVYLAAHTADEEMASEAELAEATEKLVDLVAGVYFVPTDEIFVSRERLLQGAENMGSARRLEPRFLRVTLAHEAGHAAVARRVAGEREAVGRTYEHGLGLADEGAAQFVARAALRELGFARDFEEYVEGFDPAAGWVPPYQRHREMFSLAPLLALYTDGLDFVAAVAREQPGGAPWEHLLSDPPLEIGRLRRPEHYLRPHVAPRPRWVLDDALDLLAEALGNEWDFSGVQHSEARLDGVLGLLPREVRRWVLAPLVQQAHAHVVQTRDPMEVLERYRAGERDERKLATRFFGEAELLEFTDAEAARRFVRACARDAEREDAMRHAGRRVFSSRRSVVHDGETTGFVQLRRCALPESAEHGVVLSRGELVVRLEFRFAPPDIETLRRLAHALLDDVRRRPTSAR